MANYPSALEVSLDHRCDRCQPAKEESLLSDHAVVGPSGADKEISSEARDAPAGTSQLTELSRGDRVKAGRLEVVLEVSAHETRAGTQSMGERILPNHSRGLRWTDTPLN